MQSDSGTELLYVSFWGPFGISLPFNASGNEAKPVQIVSPSWGSEHRYCYGFTDSPYQSPPKESDLRDLGGDWELGGFTGLNVAPPDASVAVVLDASSSAIVTMQRDQNNITVPVPTAIIPGCLSRIQSYAFRGNAASSVNSALRYLPGVITFYYPLKGVKGIYFRKTSGEPGEGVNWPKGSIVHLHLLVSAASEATSHSESPESDFTELVKLFPNLDLDATKFPVEDDKITILSNPPRICRAVSIIVTGL